MPFIESAISGVAIPILKQLAKAGKYAVSEAKGAYEKTQEFQDLQMAIQSYVEDYLSKHGQIKVMPGLLKEPLNLEEIYTDVELLDNDSIRLFVSPSALEEAYRHQGKRGFGSGGQRIDGIEIANEKQFLTVLGGPGVGKSTFLRKIGLEALKENGQLQSKRIPVFLELKEFRESDVDIKRKIIAGFSRHKFPSAEAFATSAMEEGKLLILFDGLDEVPTDNFNHIIQKIEEFVDEYKNNDFIVSCRVAAYRTSFRRFTDVTIAEFSDEQIEQFVYRWFGSGQDRELEVGKDFWKLLTRNEHRATKELARTPLLLTFLCLVYDREQTFPNERSTLYGRALKIILNEWAAQERLEQSPIYKNFHVALEEVMLAEIAYSSFQQNQLFFSKENITDRITDFMVDTLDAPSYLNADAILTAIEVQQGILVERAADTYSFSHLTLQEYLTASYIVSKRIEADTVRQHLVEDNWREVFLLMSGLMKDEAFKLLLSIEEKAKRYVEENEKLKILITSASEESSLFQRAASLARTCKFMDNTSNDAKVGAKLENACRATLSIARRSSFTTQLVNQLQNSGAKVEIGKISDALQKIESISNFATTGMNDAIRIAESISTALTFHPVSDQKSASIADRLQGHQRVIPKVNAPSEEWQQWASQLKLIWLEAFSLSEEAVDLSLAEAQAWWNYLYSNELIIQCKSSAVRISKAKWRKMEQRLLTLDGSF